MKIDTIFFIKKVLFIYQLLEIFQNNALLKKLGHMLSAIRNISKQRIIKEVRSYVPKSLQRGIKDKFCSFFG